MVVWVPTLDPRPLGLVLDECTQDTVRSIDYDVALLAWAHHRLVLMILFFIFARYRRLRRWRGRPISHPVTDRVADGPADRYAEGAAGRLLRIVREAGIEGVERVVGGVQGALRKALTLAAVGVLAARGRRRGEQQSDGAAS